MYIPKIANFFWGGSRLSYLQYLSIVSFKRHNPEWRVNLFMPESPESITPTWVSNEQKDTYTGRDYLKEAKKLCDVIEVAFDEHPQGKVNHEVQRSDVIRWDILYEYGGLWSDIDILYIRPIGNLFEGDVALAWHEDPYIGFIIAKPNQKIFKDLSITAKDRVQRNYDDDYQSLGAHLFRDRFDDFAALQRTYPNTDFFNLPMDVVYPYLPNQDIEEMFFGKIDKTTPNTIGVHWYNGSSTAKKYQNGFEEYRKNGSIISRLISHV